MEAPVRFDIWASIVPEHRKEAIVWLAANNEHFGEIAVRRKVSESARSGRPVLISPEVPWSAVEMMRAALPAWSASLKVVQAGHSPLDTGLSYCNVHELYFAGVLGCHVCSGFYAC